MKAEEPDKKFDDNEAYQPRATLWVLFFYGL